MENSKKKTKKKINIKGLLVVVLALYLIIMAFYYVWKLPVKTIIIKGNKLVNDNEIIEASKIDKNTKLLILSQNKVSENIKNIPLIDTVNVKKSLDGSLIINVTEAKILFYNKRNDQYVLSNKKETSDIKDILGIPTLNNYVPNDIYDNFISKLGKIDTDIIYLISEINYDPDIKNDITIDGNRFLFRMNDGNMVYINLANMDKLSSYKEIYSTLDSKGVLNLDSSSDKVIFTSYEVLGGIEEDELSEQINGNN